MSKILVTGGCGFIGSHLVDALLTAGDAVIVLDDLSTGKTGNIPLGHKNLSFVQGSITDARTVDDVVIEAEQVVHLAAVSSVRASIESPKQTHAVNFDGTLNLLDAAVRHGVNRVVFASSAAVYGNPSSLPISEDECPGPLTPYAVDKLSCECYLAFYRQHFGLDSLIFRFFNVYGPRQDASSPYSGVISLFVNHALKGEAVTVFGDGEQTRDFIYVGDVARIILRALGIEEIDGGIFNLGSGTQTSLLELVRILEELVGTGIEVRYRQPRRGDIRHSLADVTKLCALFGGKAPTPFVDGIRMLMEELGGA